MRSPAGERAAVERPGRGALVAVPASSSPPTGPFFSPRASVLDGEVSRATLFPFFPLSVSLIRILHDFPIRVRVRVGDDTVFLFPQIAFGF